MKSALRELDKRTAPVEDTVHLRICNLESIHRVIWRSLEYWCYASILKFVRPGRTFSSTSKSMQLFSFIFPGKKVCVHSKFKILSPHLQRHKNHAFNLASTRLAAIISWKSFVKKSKAEPAAIEYLGSDVHLEWQCQLSLFYCKQRRIYFSPWPAFISM